VTAAALVADLRARGVELVAAGERIRFRPASAVPPELRERLRVHKAEVLALLAPSILLMPAPPSPSTPARHQFYAGPWPDAVPCLGARAAGPFDACEMCGRGSWVRYGPAVLCLACAERACGVRS
jgi:TubC N-terminal docking domain